MLVASKESALPRVKKLQKNGLNLNKINLLFVVFAKFRRFLSVDFSSRTNSDEDVASEIEDGVTVAVIVVEMTFLTGFACVSIEFKSVVGKTPKSL